MLPFMASSTAGGTGDPVPIYRCFLSHSPYNVFDWVSRPAWGTFASGTLFGDVDADEDEAAVAVQEILMKSSYDR